MRAEAAQLRRLERAHGVDLTAYAHHGPAAGRAAAPDPRREYIGLAVAAALRSLRLPYNAEPGVGVIVCDADDITTWAQRRSAALSPLPSVPPCPHVRLCIPIVPSLQPLP